MRQQRHPGDWPKRYQALLCLAAFLAVLGTGWQFLLQPDIRRLDNDRQEGQRRHIAAAQKIRQAAALPPLQQRLKEATAALRVQQGQLSTPADMHTMLEHIAIAAQEHGLQFEFTRPNKAAPFPDDAVQIGAIRLNGPYHALGHFAADLAALRYILVLSELQLSASEGGLVAMDAVLLHHHQPPQENHRIAIAPEPAFAPLAYEDGMDRSPFDPVEMMASLPADAPAARPKQRKAPQPLEKVPLASIRMVGTIAQHGRRAVLLQVGQHMHLAGVGDYAGENFGMIRHISDHETELEELIPNADGVWTPRKTTLVLQDDKS
jgi:Tfp pilus assembly protein PilO/Tfp pilus assembly protein PilP